MTIVRGDRAGRGYGYENKYAYGMEMDMEMDIQVSYSPSFFHSQQHTVHIDQYPQRRKCSLIVSLLFHASVLIGKASG